uniref:Uncharacterized protein n=1 Tax=Timema bartmani TaxID=61472 RepID=A0A7R9F0X5_9NEOP|nr:unnamed protein product [Timema bartmani]
MTAVIITTSTMSRVAAQLVGYSHRWMLSKSTKPSSYFWPLVLALDYGVAFSILSKMVAAVPVYMNTQDKFREMEQFWKQNSEKLGTAARSFQQAMETIQGNINWKNTSYHELEVWLSRNNEGLSTT